MKSILIAVALIIGSSAFASNNNSADYNVWDGTKPTYQKCVDGEQFLTFEDNSGDSSTKVLLTCKDGKFVQSTPAPKVIICKDGSEELWVVDNANDSTSKVYYVCKNGKWQPKY